MGGPGQDRTTHTDIGPYIVEEEKKGNWKKEEKENLHTHS